MNKLRLTIIIVAMMVLCGCKSNFEEKINDQQEEVVTIYGEIYKTAFDEIMKVDEGLNSDSKYIAINIKTLEGANQKDIEYIFNEFEKYSNTVIDESLETLKEKGMVKDLNSIEGILLEIISIETISNEEVIVEVSKFRSGIGAIGMKYKLERKDNKWEIKDENMLWIS